MKRLPPELPRAAPSNIQDVLDYAEVVEGYANSRSADPSDRELLELGVRLDVYSGRLYGNQDQVIVSGLHRVIEPSNDFSETKINLKEGIYEGASNGFSVFNAEKWEPDYTADEDQDQLYEQLCARLPGRFIVAHLVEGKTQIIATPDQGVINHSQFNVVAPFRTNDILVPDRSPDSEEAAQVEAMAVLSTLDPRSKDCVREAINRLKGKDPLRSIICAAAPINTFLAHNTGDLQRQALATIISHNVPKALFITIYQAEGLPPVYHEYGDQPSGSISMVSLPFKQIVFEDLMLMERYFISKDGQIVQPPGSPPGLFLGTRAAISPRGETLKFYVPVEHLSDDDNILPVKYTES